MWRMFPRWDSFHRDDGSIVVRDSTKMMYQENLTSSNPQICNFGKQITKCVHVQNQGKNKEFHCDFTNVVIRPETCEIDTVPSFQSSGNIWYDLFQTASTFTATINTAHKYAYGDSFGNSDNADSPLISNTQPISIEAYHPLGGFIELIPQSSSLKT